MHRIYFDGNEVNEDGRVNLGIPGALRDIEFVGSELHDGLRVLLYNAEGQEMEAIIQFDMAHQHWVALPIPETLRDAR